MTGRSGGAERGYGRAEPSPGRNAEKDMMDPNSPEADDARAALQAERARVEATISRVRGAIEQDGPISRTGEAAEDTTTEQVNLELLSELEAELAEIDAATARIAAGTYGVDEVTGEPIDPERLRAVPTARTNI